jgi:NTE family protein
MEDTDKAVDLLDSFWRDNSAHSLQDRLLNDWLLQTNRFFGNTGGTPAISPYLTPASAWASDQLKGMLERHVDFGRIQGLVKPSSPMLLIGAADVVSGEFKAFSSYRDTIDVEMVLASAALPTMFEAVHTNGGVYWDGLFSQNPPVRELPDAKPDEIWVIQIDPQRRPAEPKTMPDIMDRRNELAGNLSLYQEIYFIEKINEWVAEGVLSGTKHEVIEVKWIEMLRDLDSESKLDRDPQFIRAMMAYGEDQAEAFLNHELPVGGGGVGGRTG